MKTPTKIALLGATAAAIALSVSVPVIAKDRMEAHFEKMDANADGFIDAGEIAAAADSRFAAADTNGDGALDATELAAQHEKREAKRKEKAEERRAKMITRLDANGDGLLQKEEMNSGRMERMMSHLDTDDDGRISKEEASKMRGKKRHKHKEVSE